MSWKQSPAYQQKTFKPDAVRIASALNKARIACTLEWRVPRYNEYTRTGVMKDYWVDIFVHDPKYGALAIELEGNGSASKDNEKRDEYLKAQGFKAVLHFPNTTPSEKVLEALGRHRRRVEDFP